MRADKPSAWAPARPQSKLQPGALLHVPLKATLQLQLGAVKFGTPTDTKLDAVDGIRGHLIADTGQSAGHLQNMPTQKGALTPVQLRKGVESGQFESRAATRKDMQRCIKYGAKPESMFTASPKEVEAINKDSDALHFWAGRGLTPDGRDIEEKTTTPQRPPRQKERRDGEKAK